MPPIPLRSEHQADFLRLSRLWQRKNHFSLILAATNSLPYRDALIARIDEQHTSSHLLLSPGDSPQDWLTRMNAANVEDAHHAHVTLAEGWKPEATWWQQANLLRENLADAFPWVCVVWLPDDAISDLAHHAPDLWSWREAVCSFSLPSVQAVPHLMEVEAYFRTMPRDDIPAGHLWLAAAPQYRLRGELQQALDAAQQASAIFAKHDNAWKQAQAQGCIADIFHLQGKFSEALELWSDRVLPVVEQMDMRQEIQFVNNRIRELQQLIAAQLP